MTARRVLPVLLLFAACAVLAGCGSTALVSEEDLDEQYRAAIEDAKTAAPSDIVTTLTPLLPYNDDLVWRTTTDSTHQVLMVTWGDRETLPSGSLGDTILVEEDLWATAAPQIRRFCQSLDRTDDRLSLRLAQRLGLPPDEDYDRFVEFWVDPADLVRPCPDPEVSDRECELSAPIPSTHVRISEAHREWFRMLKRTSYGPDGYPFTGLGYTYDWNPSTDPVGPSEFVARPGTPIIIENADPTAAYCDGSTPSAGSGME